MLNGTPLPWLLEDDLDNPGVRYFALRELLGQPEDNTEVRQAKETIMGYGPVPRVLGAQSQEGRWIPQDSKYQSTSWQVVFLAELGVDPQDDGVRAGCEYLLSQTTTANHAFAASLPPVPSTAVHCLNGLFPYALGRLGFSDDPRVEAAFEWQARAITGDLPGERPTQQMDHVASTAGTQRSGNNLMSTLERRHARGLECAAKTNPDGGNT